MSEPANLEPGPVMAQLAACRHAVGIAFLSDPVAWELRGNATDLARCGATRPAPWDWWLARSAHRAIALGGPRLSSAAIARTVAAHPDLVITARRHASSALVLAGPAAQVVCATLAPSPAFGGRDGEEWVLLVPRAAAPIVFRAALAAGRGAGAVAIDPGALAIHRAARRVAADQPLHPLRLRPTAGGILAI